MSEGCGSSSSYLENEAACFQSHNVVKSYGISIDASKIHEVAVEEQPESLRELGVNVFDQDVFEEGVLQQVDQAIAKQEETLEKERLNKELKSIEDGLRFEICSVLLLMVTSVVGMVVVMNVDDGCDTSSDG